MDLPRFSLRTMALVIAFEAVVLYISTLPMTAPNGELIRRSLDEVVALALAFNVCTLVVAVTIRESRRYVRRMQAGQRNRPSPTDIER